MADSKYYRLDSGGEAVSDTHPLPTMLLDASGNDVAYPANGVLDSTNVVKAPVYTYLGAQLGLACEASTGLTVPIGARYAQIQAAVQNVRYRYGEDSGANVATTPTAPTTTTGMRLTANSELYCDVATLANMRFIAETSGALLNVSYFS